MKDANGDEWFTLTEAAKQIQRNRRTVRRWVDAGMPAQRVRRVIYVRADDLYARLRLILMTEPEIKTRRERKSDVIPM